MRDRRVVGHITLVGSITRNGPNRARQIAVYIATHERCEAGSAIDVAADDRDADTVGVLGDRRRMRRTGGQRNVLVGVVSFECGPAVVQALFYDVDFFELVLPDIADPQRAILPV